MQHYAIFLAADYLVNGKTFAQEVIILRKDIII